MQPLSQTEYTRIARTAEMLAERGGMQALPGLLMEGRLPPLQVGGGLGVDGGPRGGSSSTFSLFTQSTRSHK